MPIKPVASLSAAAAPGPVNVEVPAAQTDPRPTPSAEDAGAPWTKWRPTSCDQPPCQTPGAIGCGEQTCATGKLLCCVENRHEPGSRCEPPNQGPTPSTCGDQDGDHVGDSYGCDDVSDCPSGQVCCRFQSHGAQRGRVACAAPPCQETEVCAPGHACSPGFVCQPDSSPLVGGTCVVPKRQPQPCGKLRCSGTDICCWDPYQDVTSCTERSKCSHSKLACRTSADCGPSYRCCVHGPFTPPWLSTSSCLDECDYDQWTPACQTLADCPPVPKDSVRGMAGFSGMRAKRCVKPPPRENPTAMGYCEY